MITLHLWNTNNVYAGSVEVSEFDAMPARSTPKVPPDNVPEGKVVLWVGDGWVVGDPPRNIGPAVQTRDTLLAALEAEYERRMQIIAAGYPPSERESWPVQTSEARALLADVLAVTPWIDAAAAARGLDRQELAGRIVAKDGAYRIIHGALTGARQRIEDEIDAAGDDVEALAAIKITAGWPELEG